MMAQLPRLDLDALLHAVDAGRVARGMTWAARAAAARAGLQRQARGASRTWRTHAIFGGGRCGNFGAAGACHSPWRPAWRARIDGAVSGWCAACHWAVSA
jgi:hypothetical protein